MKIIVSTHQGNVYNEEIDYVVVKNSDGEFAILNNHVPVVCVIQEGYIKLVRGELIFYIVVSNGILEYSQNQVSVLAQETHIGKDIESAKDNLNKIRQERLELNRKETADFTQKEREIRENLRKSKAGNL